MSSNKNHLLDVILHHVFRQLEYAAKANLALQFVLKFFQEGMYNYLYAHENKTERSQLVCIPSGTTKLKYKLQKTDIVDHGTKKERKLGGNFTTLRA